MVDQEIEPQLLKIILTGPSKAGKSCILARYCNDTFTSEARHTIGVEFSCKTISIQEKPVKLQIWDTAGQERFRSITSAYYRGSNAVLIIFDKSSAESFSSIESFIVQAQEHASEQTAIVIVGNKSDIESEVSLEAGHEVARRFNTIYLEVSACTGENISQLFEIASTEALRKLYKNQ